MVAINTEFIDVSMVNAAPESLTNQLLYVTGSIEHSGEDCWAGCNQQQGKCDWCGIDGWCCRQNWIGNGCDGIFGGIMSHRCVAKPGNVFQN